MKSLYTIVEVSVMVAVGFPSNGTYTPCCTQRTSADMVSRASDASASRFLFWPESGPPLAIRWVMVRAQTTMAA